MSIEQGNVVDAIGIEEATGKVILTISDHLGWDKEERHILALQEKLNTYLRFIESGELMQSYPEAMRREVVVDIVGRVPLSKGGIEFVEKARRLLEQAGYQLRVRTLEDDLPNPASNV